MAHQMKVTLTDAEYKALSIEAAKSGKPTETFLHELLDEILTRYIEPSASKKQTLSNQEIRDFLFHEGITDSVPTGEPDTEEIEAERERLARLFGQGKPASEIVIEDR